MSKFIPGDVVFVKDKNNPMTIQIVGPHTLLIEKEYQCVWFDLEKEINRDWFDESELILKQDKAQYDRDKIIKELLS